MLDPLTGIARKTLVRDRVLPGTVSVSPGGRTVYFAAAHGCQGTIESVPAAGGGESPSGRLVRQVAIGWLDRDHYSLDGDPSSHWLLYLSGPDLFLSLDGAAPFKLATGLGAAAWS